MRTTMCGRNQHDLEGTVRIRPNKLEVDELAIGGGSPVKNFLSSEGYKVYNAARDKAGEVYATAIADLRATYKEASVEPQDGYNAAVEEAGRAYYARVTEPRKVYHTARADAKVSGASITEPREVYYTIRDTANTVYEAAIADADKAYTAFADVLWSATTAQCNKPYKVYAEACIAAFIEVYNKEHSN